MKPIWSRRSFLGAVGAAVPTIAAGAMATGNDRGPAPSNRKRGGDRSAPLAGAPDTIQDVIDLILDAVGVEPIEPTVDTIKSGDPSRAVTGVATTFLATTDVIERAAEAGANLIITHEPTYYGHLDEVDWLADDPVYLHKRRLLDEHGIVVWRFHDYMHALRPDGVLAGLLDDLGWSEHAVTDTDRAALPSTFHLDPTPLTELVASLKDRLGIEHPLQVIGDPDMICRRVGLLPGAYGGRRHIEYLGRVDVDVLLVGEINEWETSIYVRDAASMGRPTALVMLGHENSEEPGMAWLAEWLRPRLDGVPVVHIPTQDAFRLL